MVKIFKNCKINFWLNLIFKEILGVNMLCETLYNILI